MNKLIKEAIKEMNLKKQTKEKRFGFSINLSEKDKANMNLCSKYYEYNTYASLFKDILKYLVEKIGINEENEEKERKENLKKSKKNQPR